MRVSFNGEGYFLWDFRDKEGEMWKPELSLAEKLAINAARSAAATAASQSSSPPLPRQPHPRDWPADARVWMHKAEFNNDDIEDIGAYWNAELSRVVIPYKDLDGDPSWIARAVDPQLFPKYLFPAGAVRTGGALVGQGEATYVVLVEDILSAYRVSWATGYDSLALLGTSLDRNTAASLSRRYERVYVWLDPDAAGRAGAQQTLRRLGALDVPALRVTSDADPKLLDDLTIKEAIANA